MQNGDFFTGSNWNDPHVIKVGDQYYMYASADVDFTQNIKIYRLVSSDLVQWSLSPLTAVFEKSPDPSAWDSKSVETPAVVFFNGLYYLFYTGYTDQSDTSKYIIGYATSTDGINWTRQNTRFQPTNPLGPPDLNFMQYIVGEPAPVIFDNKIYLYFAASGAHLSVMADMFTIGLVTSEDGINWSAPTMVLAPDQSQYPRATWKGFSTPHAQLIDNKIHLFFDVALLPFKQIRIHHAWSSNGVSDWQVDSAPILENTQIPWADDQINGPSVYLQDNKIFMWFGGQGNISLFPNISMGIGLLNCEL